MKKSTIQVQDYYNDNETVNVRVEAHESDGGTRHSHYATLTEGQIRKVKTELSNGPRNFMVTKQDEMGKEIAAEVYFNL